MKDNLFFYIILEEGVVLTKKVYVSWREIQDEYRDYVSSLGPWNAEELIGYFKVDFKGSKEWPFSEKEIKEFADSDEILLEKKA